MSKYLDLKTEYDLFVSYISERIEHVEEENVLQYITATALKIWGSNQLYSQDYAELLSELSGSHYTIEQVVTAMSCCAEEERRLLVPDFFRALVEDDQESGAASTADAMDKLSSLFVGIAMINGDFTTEEANTIMEILTGLLLYAHNRGVRVPSVPDYSSRVTERREESYLQNDALLAASKKKPAEKEPVNAPEKEAPPTLTINVHLTADDSVAAETPFIQAAPKEKMPTISAPPADNDSSESMESLLDELDGLVGLNSVKQDVHSLMNFIKVTRMRAQRGMKVPTMSYHLVFTGNPGTGKTTVARLVAKLYYHMGILPQGQLVETDRSALVAGYLGQTAIKTQKVIQQAMGGVLFIDEAYALAGETDDSYGKEAIETILKAMEDHRDELVVIVAGYTELMHKFIESNPGLSSRFSKYFEFPDYTGEELLAIFQRFCEKNGYSLDSEAVELLHQCFESLYAKRDEHFGNARTARNIFEKAINAQADRIAMLPNISDSDLELITVQDIASAIGGAR